MNRMLIFSLLVATILGSASAYADRGRYSGNHYRDHRGPYYYAPRYHGHHSYNGAYFLGGVLIGTILYDAFVRPPANEVYYVERYRVPPSSRTIYRDSAAALPPVTGRRLLRDINGKCFERTVDEKGDELRTELPASECDW